MFKDEQHSLYLTTILDMSASLKCYLTLTGPDAETNRRLQCYLKLMLMISLFLFLTYITPD